MSIATRIALDRIALQGFAALFGVDSLSGVQAKRVLMPLKTGGLGFQSCEVTGDAAYLGSWAACLAPVCIRLGLLSDCDFRAQCPEIDATISTLSERARSAGARVEHLVDRSFAQAVPKQQRL